MTLLTSVFMGVSHLYLIWRLNKATGYITTNRLLRSWPWIIMLSFYALPVTGLAVYGTSGQINVLEMPKFFTYWYWFGLVFSLQLMTGILLLDSAKIVIGRFYDIHPGKLCRWYGIIALLISLAVFVFTALKMTSDTTRIRTETMEMQVAGWPEQLDGFRLIHISDIQGDQYTGKAEIRAYVDKINELNPELVIFTGDLISYGTDYIRLSAGEMGRIEAPFGTYAVVGDHDYWAGVSHVETALKQHGIDLLRNENRYVRIGDTDSLLITGITHVYSERAQPETVRQLTADSSRAALKVLASHQVSEIILSEAEQQGYQLLLAGHTHGGQVRIPIFGFTFSASDLETNYVSGAYRREGLLINVNNGLGFTLAPVRYNAPPLVTMIEIRSKPVE